MTGRVTDAYTNIATVKLFSQANREAGLARAAMQDFMQTAYAQMRLVSGFEIVNHVLSMALLAATAGAAGGGTGAAALSRAVPERSPDPGPVKPPACCGADAAATGCADHAQAFNDALLSFLRA